MAGPRARRFPFIPKPVGGGHIPGLAVRRLSLVVAGALIALALLSIPVLSASPVFEPNHIVNDDAGTAEQKRVAAVADPSGNVYVAWQDFRGGDFDIYFAKSSDGGRTFSGNVRIDGAPSAATQERPALALGPNGEIVAVWHDDRRAYMDFDIYASVSFDKGATFSPAVRVSDGPNKVRQFNPSVAVDLLGNVYVAWQDFRSGHGDIRIARATLSSFSFSPSVRVDDDVGSNGTQASPSVVVSSLGTVYVAYHDNRSGEYNGNVYLAKSTDGGRSFGLSVRVDDTGTATWSQGQASLAIDSVGNLFIVWQDARNNGEFDYDVYFAKSTDGGRTFSRNIRVDDAPRGSSQTAPRIAVGTAGTLYVVWGDERNVDSDIYFSSSTDGGATFAPGARVDDAPDSPTNPAPQYLPQIVESATGLVAVLWQDLRKDRDSGDIYASTSFLAVGPALRVDVSLQPWHIAPGEKTDIVIRVTSDGTGVDGAAVTLSANVSGALGSVVALGSGNYAASYVPYVTMGSSGGTIEIAITARAAKVGYVSGAGQAPLRVSPRIAVSLTSPWDVLAVGQTMGVTALASSSGVPVVGGSITATVSPGGALNATSGWTDGAGTWKTTLEALTGAGGTTVTVMVSVAMEGFLGGSATATVTVWSAPRLLQMSLASDRKEMMSFEAATLTVRLSSGGIGVPRAIISGSSVSGGAFTPAVDYGNGTYTLRFVAPPTGAQTWLLLNVIAKVGGYSDAKGKITILLDPNKTNPSNPTSIFVLARPGSATVPSRQSLTFTLYLYTIEGYAISGATVVASTLSSAGALSNVVDKLNGVYVFLFTASTVSSDTAVLIKVQASKYGYATRITQIGLIVSP